MARVSYALWQASAQAQQNKILISGTRGALRSGEDVQHMGCVYSRSQYSVAGFPVGQPTKNTVSVHTMLASYGWLQSGPAVESERIQPCGSGIVSAAKRNTRSDMQNPPSPQLQQPNSNDGSPTEVRADCKGTRSQP